ncbi:MAG: hypothetical protein OXE17_11300 [Chloroflexi bacterium]|nr:hypothetical protein [Chloroflexota bacterium]
MIDDPFYGQMPDGERPDIMLYIFPHLREFLAVDLRDDTSEVILMNSDDVFDADFFGGLEAEFSRTLREGNIYPFAHVINLPLRLEEIVRTVAMASILEKLGVDSFDDEDMPAVVVFIISGGALAMHSDKLIENLRELLNSYPGGADITQWEGVISRLVKEENQVLQELSYQELTEALRDDSPDYFTLWENRN